MKNILLASFISASLAGADYQIILPDGASPSEKTAAMELSEHLSKSIGQKIPINSPTRPSGIKTIHLGNSEMARKMKISVKKLAPEEYLVRAFDENNLIITGGKPRGTLYGVYEFLEREIGVIWLDQETTYIPEKPDYVWNSKLMFSGKPAFQWRCLYSYFTDDPEKRITFAVRSRQNYFYHEQYPLMNQWEIFRPFGAPKSDHTFYSYTKNWPKENDDCRSKDASGKIIFATSSSGPGQICMSSSKTRKVVLEQLRNFIKSDREKGLHPVFYAVTPNDNPQKCECKNCREMAAKYQSHSGVLLDFLNELADGIAKDYPDVYVLASAYMFTLEPPVGIQVRPNVIIQIAQLGDEWGGASRDSMRPLSHPNNKSSLDIWKRWSSVARCFAYDYLVLYMGRERSPFINLEAISENLRLYHSMKVPSFFAEAEQIHITTFHPLRLYIAYRFMNHPDSDLNQEVEKFMSAYYRKAAPYMLEYYHFLVTQNSMFSKSPGAIPLNKRSDLTPEFFKKANELLDKAEQSLKNSPELQQRVSRERISVDRAMLDISRFRQPLPGFDRQPVLRRYAENMRNICRKEFMTTSQQKKYLKELDEYIAGQSVNIQIPEEFKNRDVIAVMGWPDLRGHGTLADDSEAIGGRCLKIEEPDRPFEFFTYGLYSKGQIQDYSKIEPGKIQKDGKFHFYPFGKTVKIPESGYFYLHKSWRFQADISSYHDRSNLNNDVEIWFSARLTGPGYVPGVKTGKNSASVDCVVLLKPIRDEEKK